MGPTEVESAYKPPPKQVITQGGRLKFLWYFYYLGFGKLKNSTTNNLLVLEFNINPFFITTSRVDLISHSRARSPDSRFEPSNCNTMRQLASPMLSVPLVLDDCCTWRSHSCPTMTTRTNPTMKEAETPKPARQEGALNLIIRTVDHLVIEK